MFIFAPSLCYFEIMKQGIHPENYRLVVFKDMSNGTTFLTYSTVNTKETITHEDGNEYPLFKLDISSESHPFYTGKSNFVDRAGRIEKFNNRYKNFSTQKEENKEEK